MCVKKRISKVSMWVWKREWVRLVCVCEKREWVRLVCACVWKREWVRLVCMCVCVLKENE